MLRSRLSRNLHWVSRRIATITVGFVAGAMIVGCQGGIHHKGEQRLSFLASYGEPFSESVVFNGGRGTGQNAALTIGYEKFFEDRFAFTVSGTPYRIYNQDDADVYAAEFQIGVKYYIHEFDLLDRPVALYAEILGGIMYGVRSVPEEGHTFNFTQDTGLGLEWQITDSISWVSGYRLKHLSNGNFFNDDNPSQNDHFAYTGLSISW